MVNIANTSLTPGDNLCPCNSQSIKFKQRRVREDKIFNMPMLTTHIIQEERGIPDDSLSMTPFLK